MRKNFPFAMVAVVLALCLPGCGRESDDHDEGEGGAVAGPSAVLPQATPAPTPTPVPEATPSPTPSPTSGGAAVAYEPDVRSILDAKCVRCHSSLGTYRGVLTYASPGDAGSLLVQVTGPGGGMSRYLSTTEGAVLRQWVLAGAPERR